MSTTTQPRHLVGAHPGDQETPPVPGRGRRAAILVASAFGASALLGGAVLLIDPRPGMVDPRPDEPLPVEGQANRDLLEDPSALCVCAGPEKGNQGRELLRTRILDCNEGDFDAALWAVRADSARVAAGHAIDRARVNEGRLTGRLASPSGGSNAPSSVIGEGWEGARLRAAALCTESERFRPIEATITAVQQEEKGATGEPGATERYAVAVTLPDTTKRIDVCADAIAIPGYWDRAGVYHHDESRLTFACGASVAAKCVQTWRYDPSRSEGMPALLTACTRMARADYCGDGGTFTKDGTEVDVWDTMGHNDPSDPGIEGATFEAAWGPGGALCLNHLRTSAPLPSCFASLPRCDTEARAKEIADEQGDDGHIVFNASVEQH